jgi:hypothetical protein
VSEPPAEVVLTAVAVWALLEVVVPPEPLPLALLLLPPLPPSITADPLHAAEAATVTTKGIRSEEERVICLSYHAARASAAALAAL